MTGLVRKATLLGVCGLIFAGVAYANVPDPAHSSLNTFVFVGGRATPSAGPDPTVAYTVTVRDFANNPIAGSNVQLNFGACTDTKLCLGTTGVNCTGGSGGTPIVAGLTNASGAITFSVMGASNNWGDNAHCPASGSPTPQVLCPGAGAACVTIYADGVILGHATAIDYDEDGANSAPGSVNAADLSKLKTDITGCSLVSPIRYVGRSDFDHNNVINSTDISFLKTVIANGLSAVGCYTTGSPGSPSTFCP